MQSSDFCSIPELNDLMQAFQRFADERDWEKFHNPKNLSMALTIEAAELMEIFQWQTPEEALSFLDGQGEEKQREKIAAEVADVFLYLMRICQRLKIDPIDSSRKKMVHNAEKYPVAKSYGKATKYTEL